MGYATLGFPNGPGLRFRIDPDDISWDFKIKTSVINTVGGRVVQVMGATLSDITIQGTFGEDRTQGPGTDGGDHPGISWRLAQRFKTRVRQMMEHQSEGATDQGRMGAPAVFTYPPQGWNFRVYVKDFADPDGGTMTIRTGKFVHRYVLVLFVVQEGSTALTKAGSVNGVINQAKAQAINEYIGRISSGIGWEPSKYNGNFRSYYDEIFAATAGETDPGARRGPAGDDEPFIDPSLQLEGVDG